MSADQSKSLLARRQRVLAPTYRLFYAEPVHVVSASGVWLYDADGRRYLDAYNNVPVVGHCHPFVAEALGRQSRVLNTHTRYLSEKPLELAERLLESLPREISNIIFTCTGSESNDLAARVCKAATGGTGFIVTDYAYHGTTETIAGMSPSTGIETGPGVYTVQVPIASRDTEEFGARVRRCIGAMHADGIKPAGLLVDTIFSSDGVVAQPEGFLAGAVSAIHDAGGLFIADEVQAGLGRTGHMWGFQRHGIVPDLVTMGKPLGNGHPVAALAIRPEAVTEFARRTRYFNTFGGNSVSCAVALAVLDVIGREGLLTNARETGTYLRKGLEQLATRHRSIAAVRGAGLFIGVDIAANPRTSLDSREETARIVDGLRHEGVLIGTEGRNDDVLKIRPPLPFGRSEADLLLEKLDVVLSDATTG